MLTGRIMGHRSPQAILTDFILLFFVFFIVLYPLSVIGTEEITSLATEVASLLRLERLLPSAAEAQENAGAASLSLREVEARLGEMLGHSPLEGSVIVSRTQEGLVVSLLTEGFFHPDSMSMRPAALVMLERIAPLLRQTWTPIRIEGHTDETTRISEVFAADWELSTGRAIAVLRTLLSLGIAPSRLSVVGYAGNRPVASNATPQGRMRNRRVDIVLIGDSASL